MKKLLLFSFLLSFTIQVNAQQLIDLEDQHSKLAQESELQRKNKIGTYRNVVKRDSTYRYEDVEDNLTRKWIYYDYNLANNYSSYHDFDYEGNMQWSPNFIRNQEFNPDGSVSSYVSQRYVNDEWINSSKSIFEYNDSGFQTLDYRESWDDDLQEWVPARRFERIFNADNTLLTLTYYNRDFSSGNLELAYITNYTNVDNVITEWIMEYYNDGEIYETTKTEVYLNAENDRDSTYRYEWNEEFSTWDLTSRYIYPADINAPVRKYQTDLYREMTNSWDPQFLSIYTDDTDINEIQYWDRFRSDEGQSEVYLESRLEYFWSINPLLDVEAAPGNEIDIILPNPFEGNPKISVDGLKGNATLVIYDVLGNTVFTKDLKQSNSFILNKNLPNGTYVINLIQADNILKAKKIFKIR